MVTSIGQDWTRRVIEKTLTEIQDELRLLRLRTKKQEIVVVPDPKYLLIVIHDTPPA